MNTDMHPQATGMPGLEAGKKTPWLRWVALGCGGLVILLAVLLLVIFMFVKQATAAPEAVVQQFLAAAGAGDVVGAHDCFSAPLKEEQSLEAFTAAVEANGTLFRVAETSFTNRSVDLNGAEFSGTLTLESGTEVPASFSLVRENEDWKLISYSIGN